MEYYIEYIFAENFLIDFILLYITGNLIKKKIVFKRLTAASFVGAVYVILAAYIGREFMTYFIVKLSISVLMIMIAYDSKGIIANIKVILCFYIVTLIMVGIITALQIFSFNRLTVNLIIISMFLGFLILKLLFYEIKRKKDKENYIRSVTIDINNKRKTIKGFIDTGNELTDPLTGKPVVIINIECMKELLDEDIINDIIKFYNSDENSFMDLFLEKSYKLKLRVIKYNTISNKGKLMVCIVPNDITILGNDKNIIKADAIIGIYPQKISINDDYEALLFKKLLDWESDNNENLCKCC